LAVAQIAPGTQVNIKVLRPQRGEAAVERTLTASLGSLPPELVRGGRGQEPGADSGQNASRDALDGVEVTDLDARYRRQFNIPSNVAGALVVTVAPDSNAAEAGLRPGDVITSIDQEPVENADDAVELTEKASGDQMLLRVWSRGPGGEGGTRFVVVDNRKRESGR
jgi:serine protease Do